MSWLMLALTMLLTIVLAAVSLFHVILIWSNRQNKIVQAQLDKLIKEIKDLNNVRIQPVGNQEPIQRPDNNVRIQPAGNQEPILLPNDERYAAEARARARAANLIRRPRDNSHRDAFFPPPSNMSWADMAEMDNS